MISRKQLNQLLDQNLRQAEIELNSPDFYGNSRPTSAEHNLGHISIKQMLFFSVDAYGGCLEY